MEANGFLDWRSLLGPITTECSPAKRTFLTLEGHRRELEAHLHRDHRRRRVRYRDLVLVTTLIGLEYEHLVGRANRSRPRPLADGPTAIGRDRPAGWARPWGMGTMFELRSAFLHYADRRDRLARRLSVAARIRAEAEAKRRLSSLCMLEARELVGRVVSDRLEPLVKERREELKPRPQAVAPTAAVAAGGEAFAVEVKPWARALFTKTAMIAAAVVLVAAVDAGIKGGVLSGPKDGPSGSLAKLSGPSPPPLGGLIRAPSRPPVRSAEPVKPQHSGAFGQTADAGTRASGSGQTDQAPPGAAAAPQTTPQPAAAVAPAPAPAVASSSTSTSAQQEFGFEN